jgi:hypothetical protein
MQPQSPEWAQGPEVVGSTLWVDLVSWTLVPEDATL